MNAVVSRTHYGFSAPPPVVGGGHPQDHQIRCETCWECGCVSAVNLGRCVVCPGCLRVAESGNRGGRGMVPCPHASREKMTPQTHYSPSWHRWPALNTVKQLHRLYVLGQVFQGEGEGEGESCDANAAMSWQSLGHCNIHLACTKYVHSPTPGFNNNKI